MGHSNGDGLGMSRWEVEGSRVHRKGLVSAPFNTEPVALVIEEMGPGPELGNLGTGLLKSV